MSTSHTPGPWHVLHPTAYGWDIRSADGKWVALVNNDHDNPDGFPTNEEGKANAYLMAASLDLLKECKKAIAAYDLAASGIHTKWKGEDVDAMRSAIAKAEGSPNAR